MYTEDITKQLLFTLKQQFEDMRTCLDTLWVTPSEVPAAAPAAEALAVTGDIVIDGSSTVFPLSERMADRFKDEGYSGNITIDNIGSGAGFQRFCVSGETDISNASRRIRDSEIESSRAIGRDPIEFRVGTDALAVLVSRDNDFITNITFEELALIFSNQANRWSEVNPNWPDEDILRFIPGTDHGTFDYFVEKIFNEDEEPILDAANTQLIEDYNDLVQHVGGNPHAIGFSGYAHYHENTEMLKILSIEGIEPTRATVDSGDYQLARPLFIYSSADILQEKQQVAAFINFYLTIVNEEIDDVGYFPASDAALASSHLAWQNGVGAAWREEEKGKQGVPAPAIVTARDWLVYKCLAAIRVIEGALESQRPPEQAISDLNLIFKEMRARSVAFFPACREYDNINSTRIEDCTTRFEATSTTLYFLCLIQANTVPQVGFFLQVYYASQHMADGFGQVLDTAQRWADHWGDCFYGEDLSQIKPVLNSLISESDAVKEAAFKAAMSCKLEIMQESREILCTELPRIYDKYYHLTCGLDRLHCCPDMEPTVRDEVYASLNQTGQYVANALQATQMISLAEENWLAPLKQSWDAIAQQVMVVRDNTYAWAEQQFCPPPSRCLEATQKLVSCTQQAVQQLAALQGDRLSIAALNQQAQSVKCVNDELVKLIEQTAKLTHFDQSVYDKFWWLIARIRVTLSRCEKEEEEICVLTKDDLTHILQGLKGTFGQVGPKPVYAYPPTLATPKVSTTRPEVVSTAIASQYIQIWEEAADLVAALERKIPHRLKPRVEPLRVLTQQMQDQLQARPAFPQQKLIRRMQRQWTKLRGARKATTAIFKDSVTDEEMLAHLDQFGEQWEGLEQHMQKLLDEEQIVAEHAVPVRGDVRL